MQVFFWGVPLSESAPDKGTTMVKQPRENINMLILLNMTKAISILFILLQAVDVVGQAGKPKTITGFQTHTTPVLLAYGERAELATEEYLPLSPIMEGFVILRKNPDYEA